MVFLELRREDWGSSCVETGPSGTALVASEKSSLFKLQGAGRDSS